MTLVMESGRHVLKQPRQLTGSTVANFTMISDGASIVFEFTGSLTINGQGYAEVRGITFSISNSVYAAIYVYSLQEVIFQDCHFQRVRIYYYDVDNATFSGCNFSDYYHSDGYGGALHMISYSLVFNLLIIRSNFINNTGAIYFRTYSRGASLVVMKCKFINNTAEYDGGGAIYVSGKYCHLISVVLENSQLRCLLDLQLKFNHVVFAVLGMYTGIDDVQQFHWSLWKNNPTELDCRWSERLY